MREKEIAELVRQNGREAAEKLTEALINSNWPDCNRFANALAQLGGDDAKAGLLRALKGRRHHIRSAAIKALTKIGGHEVREAIAALGNDSAYEVRQDVAEALRLLDEQKD